MSLRFQVLKELIQKRPPKRLKSDHSPHFISEDFAAQVFTKSMMQEMLPTEVFENVSKAMEGKEKLKNIYADTIASAMKKWAVKNGATHFTHWFQPLTGGTAEKHDAFIDWQASEQMIEKFQGNQLLIGEPDASSFPSGGLRSTFEARGYTGWDPSSPVFIWKGGDGVTLCIPSVFFSWTGDVLDSKIPLLRSEARLKKSINRLLQLTGLKSSSVFATCGFEQEYFVIEKALRDARPDLLLCGRTLFGFQSPKGQELQDHYFTTVKDRILSYMLDVENTAMRLGIPIKTRHNEVAPSQHEIAPGFEPASRAVDHNILLMEVMRQTATRHDLSCLLHEKPFAGINGSGKHANWSIMTEDGINLLDPTDTPENNWHFLILLTAIVHGVYCHADVLRSSIASSSNDLRLGGHEAPPAILSIYLGETLEALLNNLEEKGKHVSSMTDAQYDLEIPVIPELPKDNTDRNRTSPFAFTGNKFEFRALGSSQNPAFSIAILNLIVAESVELIVGEIEAANPQANLVKAALPVIQKYLKISKPIRFSGDNYSDKWLFEAKNRGLSNVSSSDIAFKALLNKKTEDLFEGILKPHELKSRYEVQLEIYIHMLQIEARILVDLLKTGLIPAAIEQQTRLAKSILKVKNLLDSKVNISAQESLLQNLTLLINQAVVHGDEIQDLLSSTKELDLEACANLCSSKLRTKCGQLRDLFDKIEVSIDDRLWPWPKYRELLFLTM